MTKLLHSPFDFVAKNTIDYWMKPDSVQIDQNRILSAFEAAKWDDRSTLQYTCISRTVHKNALFAHSLEAIPSNLKLHKDIRTFLSGK